MTGLVDQSFVLPGDGHDQAKARLEQGELRVDIFADRAGTH